jgi:hypothetical protein
MTKQLEYVPQHLKKRKVINRWLTSGIYEKKMKFVPTTMEGDVNDWLIKGFSIHENPCRKEFVAERRNRLPKRIDYDQSLPGSFLSTKEQEKPWVVYFPWGNPRVEWSGFWFVPTHLCTYAVTGIMSPSAHQAKLFMKTCGGLTVWLNGSLVMDFTPFTRNIEQETEVLVGLQEGHNELILICEDLAERDTQYYFSMEYEGAEEIGIHVPIGSWTSAGKVQAVERALEAAYFPQDCVTAGDVKLCLINPLAEPLEFSVVYGSEFDGNFKRLEAVLQPGADELVFGDVSDFAMDFSVMQLETRIGSLKISKVVALQLFPREFGEIQAGTVQERKRLALSCIADQGKPNIHTAIARLNTGRDVSAAQNLILKGIAEINERRDCADFYLVGLFKLWKEYRHTDLFEPAFWDELKHCVLNFRYWIDEPGDDVMWFFSENHALLFHTCQMLGGQLFPDDTFTNSGESGRVQKAKGEERLLHWFERFFAEGLAEWNSSAYIPIDALGLLHIYDLAESEELRTQAKKAMDLLYYYITLNSHNGYLATTFGRSYEKEIKGHYTAGTTSMCFIGYGAGNVNCYAYSNVILCLSDYVPPKAYEANLNLADGESLLFKCEQGKEGYAKLYTYRTADYSMSSIYNFRPGRKGYQEHVAEVFLTPEAQVWVNHPGELNCFGTGRPSYWAGNGYLPKVAQHLGLCVLQYRIDNGHSVNFTHAYFPVSEFDRTERSGHWYFAEKDDAYIAVYARNGLELQWCGPDSGRELRSVGYENVWVLRVSNRRESGSFERFMADVGRMELNVSDAEVGITDVKYGKLHMAWEGLLSINGAEQSEDFAGVLGTIERNMSQEEL